MTVRLLLVEDDPRIAAALQRGLSEEGYSVDVERDGLSGLDRATSAPYSLIILDRGLPGIDGLEICRRLRRSGSSLPILMLTARDALHDKIEGLKEGADDYVTKPFAFDEVLARVETLLRRATAMVRSSMLQVGDLRLDHGAKTVWCGGREIALTAREFAVLNYLMSRAGDVVGQMELLQNIWNLKFDPGTKVVEVHIRLLRRKLDVGRERSFIKTVRGFGYMIESAA
jgi:two-component system, OmpR family, response regulator